MDRRTYDFIEEPRGIILRRLFQELRKYSSTASLVLRGDLELGDAGHAILARLEPRLLARRRDAAWPWTMLLDHHAVVHHFKLDDELLEELLRASDGVYDWHQPHLPEDLALQRDDGSTILGSTSHDQHAWLELSDHEYESLVRSLPALLSFVRPHEHEYATTAS